ncbi:MAG: hypothetical protein Q7S88_02435 [Candidatus Daviesbacteria bacterium]|nr:hypothetical protein [Candidatus Daviesbacteria bacterium]
MSADNNVGRGIFVNPSPSEASSQPDAGPPLNLEGMRGIHQKLVEQIAAHGGGASVAEAHEIMGFLGQVERGRIRMDSPDHVKAKEIFNFWSVMVEGVLGGTVWSLDEHPYVGRILPGGWSFRPQTTSNEPPNPT